MERLVVTIPFTLYSFEKLYIPYKIPAREDLRLIQNRVSIIVENSYENIYISDTHCTFINSCTKEYLLGEHTENDVNVTDDNLNSTYDFMFDSNYLSDNTFFFRICEVNMKKISTPLTLRVYDIEDEKLYEEWKINNIECFQENILLQTEAVKISPKPKLNTDIPKIIYQTCEQIRNVNHYNAIMSFVYLCPEFELQIYNNEKSRKFIVENKNCYNLSEAYDTLVSGSYKADIFRYLIMYVKGGIYFDCKMILRTPLNDVLRGGEKIYVCKDISDHGYYNAFIASVPGNETFNDLLKHICSNVLDRVKPSRTLSLTGPMVFKDFFHETEPLFQCVAPDFKENYKHNVILNVKDCKVLCNRFNSGHMLNKAVHYHYLFEKNLIYFNYLGRLKRYDFFIACHDIFSPLFFVLDFNILHIYTQDVRRLKKDILIHNCQNSGRRAWKGELYIQVINKMTENVLSTHKIIQNNGYYQITFPRDFY
jgi:mannosyltransferase OCH1-like enzyme